MDTASPVISRMQEPIGRDARLALDLALTLRHDGTGRVADDLADPAGLTAWARAHPDVLPGTAPGRADDHREGLAAGTAPRPADGDGEGAAFTADAAQLAAVREPWGAMGRRPRALRPGRVPRRAEPRGRDPPHAPARSGAAAERGGRPHPHGAGPALAGGRGPGRPAAARAPPAI
jgi:hypothetical protein